MDEAARRPAQRHPGAQPHERATGGVHAHGERRAGARLRARWHGTMAHRLELGAGGDAVGRLGSPVAEAAAEALAHATARPQHTRPPPQPQQQQQQPRLRSLGYKPNHARIMQQIRGGGGEGARGLTASRIHSSAAASQAMQQQPQRSAPAPAVVRYARRAGTAHVPPPTNATHR